MATLRRGIAPPSHIAMPADVRLMNAVSTAVFVLAAVAGLVACVLWLMRSPLFPIRGIQLDGDLMRNSVPTIRANAAPRLAGNFFSVDLQQGRQAFESVPWVRSAVVRRVWPDRLAVRLEEHRAVALWSGDGETAAGGDRLVNSHGEVFDANVGDVEDDALPTLIGPEGSAPAMLALYQRVQAALVKLERDITILHLSGRGSGRAELDSGARIELGRGTEDEVVARTERFVRTLAAATAQTAPAGTPLEYADLRHQGGYAVRLRGFGNTSPAGAAAAKTN